jgi:hypothetical protein
LIDIRVDPTDTITTIKKKKADKLGLDADKFKLKIKDAEITDESKTVFEAGIEEGSTITVVYKKISLSVTTTDG